MTRARHVGAAALLGAYAWLLLVARVTLWHDAIASSIVLLLATRLVDPRAERRLPVLALLAAAALYVHLLYVWRVGYAGRHHVFAGLFGLSDAGEYYVDAERVLHGFRMNTGGARRPIFSAVLAGVLRLVGNDLRVAHVATLLFWAGGLAFAASEVWRTHGRRVALVVFVVLVLFARRYVGFVQSEGVGGPLGAIAFGLLWRANSMKTGWVSTYRGALLLQTLALLARPGPIFALAGVVAWGALRAEKEARWRLIAESAAIAFGALLLQELVRSTSTELASFNDLPPILYGLIHYEDSRFVWQRHPWLAELPEAARSGAIWRLIAGDLAARPWLVLVAPLRCFASWFYLPQGFFSFVWLNPDDRVLEDARAVREAMADYGYLGPARLWIRELGGYSLANAIAMALAAAAFWGALLRSTWRALRARAAVGLGPVLLGVLVSLPLLPPWITEGAQIHASVFVYIVTFAVTAFLPANEAATDGPSPRAAPRLGPAIAAVLALLVTLPRIAPRKPPSEPCAAGDGFLGDVDRGAVVVYGTEQARPTLSDARANLVLLERSNGAFARGLGPTLGRPHEIAPVFDACRGRLVYLVHDLGSSVDPIRQGQPWATFHTAPIVPALTPALERTAIDGP